jgi:hypothetical protein
VNGDDPWVGALDPTWLRAEARRHRRRDAAIVVLGVVLAIAAMLCGLVLLGVVRL